MARPSSSTSLECLSKKRLITLARDHNLDTAQTTSNEGFVAELADALEFTVLLEAFTVAELKTISKPLSSKVVILSFHYLDPIPK